MSVLKWVLLPAAAAAALIAGFLAWRAAAPGALREVVAYVSTDQEIAEPILKRFALRTGIRVRAAYDTEASKTAGLAMRILAERARPQADVFWASEPTRPARLAREGVLAPYPSPEAEGLPAYPGWTAFSSRARVILVNTGLVSAAERPRRFTDLLDPRWRGRVAISDPRFGTMSAHAAALGEEGPRFAAGLRANDVRVLSGNAMVREYVEQGLAAAGLVDTDDAWAAVDRGKPVAMVVPEDAVVIPNAAALVRGGPHPEEARLLMDFLVSREVEALLAEAPMRQPPLRPDVPVPAGVARFGAPMPDWDALGAEVEARAVAFHKALAE